MMRLPTRRGLTAVLCTAAAAAATSVTLPASPAHAADRDARVCSEVAGGNTINVRNNLDEKHPILLLWRTGYLGSTDHFYITETHQQSNGAVWYYGKGYGYGDSAAWGYVLQSWVSNPNGACAT
jgi:hypothetical protein